MNTPERLVFGQVSSSCHLTVGPSSATSQEQQPDRGTRLMRLIGVWQIKAHNGYFTSVPAAYYRLVAVIVKPVMVPIMVYYAFSFMWAVGINVTSSILLGTPREAGGYGFTARGVGFVYFTPVVAICLGELFGHFFNDFLANRYIKKHNGVFKPEARLPANYIAAVLMIPGLIIVGQALKHLLHWSAIVMGWGIYVSSPSNSYQLSSKPVSARYA
jgi:hypothetical protein